MHLTVVCILNLPGSGHDAVAGYREYGNEISSSIELGKILDKRLAASLPQLYSLFTHDILCTIQCSFYIPLF
jgi:hypothetical protein